MSGRKTSGLAALIALAFAGLAPVRAHAGEVLNFNLKGTSLAGNFGTTQSPTFIPRTTSASWPLSGQPKTPCMAGIQEMRFVDACVIKAWLAVPLILNRMDPSNPRRIETGSTTGKFVVPTTRMFIGSEIPTCFPPPT